MKEQDKQFNIAQQLREEEFDASKSQFQQNLTETKRQADMGYDINKQQLGLQNEELKLKQQRAQMDKEQYDYNIKKREATKGITRDVAQFYKTKGDKESQYRNVLEDQSWYEKAYRGAYNKGSLNPLVGVNYMMGLFGGGVETSEQTAARQSGYSNIDTHQPNLIQKYGDMAPSLAFEATQRYLPSQFGETESIDRGMSSPLMLGMYNQFGGDY